MATDAGGKFMGVVISKLAIRHRTTYRYRSPVQLLPHRLMLRPRESRELQLLSHEVNITPDAVLTWSRDIFGNDVALARFVGVTDLLVIESNAVVEHSSPAWPVYEIDASAISYPFRYSDADWVDLGQLAVQHFPDPSGEFERWVMGFVAPTPTDTLSLLKDLNLGVHYHVKYQRREDEGTQEPAYTLASGFGSCRDLAVQMVEAARVLGFGARLVSGYLADMDGDLVGTSDAGATHAWAEVFVPGPGWIAFDPTNGTMGDAYLIAAAVVRDISQAVPASGSFVGPGNAFERLVVEVGVSRIPSDIYSASDAV